jgi:hypothetical protein
LGDECATFFRRLTGVEDRGSARLREAVYLEHGRDDGRNEWRQDDREPDQDQADNRTGLIAGHSQQL